MPTANRSPAMLYLLLVTYGTVFLTELVGDKTLYTVGSLSSRFHPLPVFAGILLAFGGKVLVAVLAGQAVAELPPALVASMTAATFFVTAFVIWRKERRPRPKEGPAPGAPSKALLVSFAAVFFTEWADSGQITAAALAARYQAPAVVWLGATLALMTKGLLAMTLGVGLRRHVPDAVLRPVTIGLCLTMGVFSAFRWWA